MFEDKIKLITDEDAKKIIEVIHKNHDCSTADALIEEYVIKRMKLGETAKEALVSFYDNASYVASTIREIIHEMNDEASNAIEHVGKKKS